MADKKRIKGITYCGECVYYNHKKHKCELGAKQETNPKDPFFDDCPIPDVEQLDVEEIRAKAIDEFAERMKEMLKDIQFAEFQGIDVCPCAKTGEECPYINQDIGCQYCAREQTVKDIDRIAEQLKAGGKNE